MPMKKHHRWPSPAAGSIFASVAATHWIFTFWPERHGVWDGVSANDSLWSFLPRAGAILAQRSKSCLVKVLTSAEYGFLAVDVVVEVDLQGGRWFMCKCDRDNIKFHHVVDMEDWLELKVEPGLQNGHRGPVGWQTAGEPMSLEQAALVNGLVMTYSQMMALLKHFQQGQAVGKPSKKNLHLMLISLLVPSELQEAAKKHVAEGKGGAADEDGFDSDFSELISELGQDDGNQQDLKEYKEKKKYHRLKRNMGTADEPLEGKKKPKAKAKGKAKAKAKSKPKAKAKMSLGQSLAKKAREKMRMAADMMDVDEEGRHEDQDGAMPGQADEAEIEGHMKEAQGNPEKEAMDVEEAAAEPASGGGGEVAEPASGSGGEVAESGGEPEWWWGS